MNFSFSPIHLKEFYGFNSYSHEEFESDYLNNKFKIINYPIASIDGLTLSNIEESSLTYKNKKEIKNRLIRMQSKLDRNYRRP